MSKKSASEYLKIVDAYSDGIAGLQAFWKAFDDKWAGEAGMDQALYDILDTLWGALEVATEDPVLLAERSGYIGVDELRAIAVRQKGLLQKFIARA